jgi:hypothetical protein
MADFRALIARQDAGWSAHDLDTIMPTYTPSIMFNNHTAGEAPVCGRFARRHEGPLDGGPPRALVGAAVRRTLLGEVPRAASALGYAIRRRRRRRYFLPTRAGTASTGARGGPKRLEPARGERPEPESPAETEGWVGW